MVGRLVHGDTRSDLGIHAATHLGKWLGLRCTLPTTTTLGERLLRSVVQHNRAQPALTCEKRSNRRWLAVKRHHGARLGARLDLRTEEPRGPA
ncbi:hypothetical protein D3C81_2103790 [compost metagenome]